jgi:hypothetical protein
MRKWLTWTFLALGLAVLLAPAASAQAPQSTEEQPIVVSDDDAKAMGISTDTKNQIKSINQSRNDQIKAVSQDNSLTGQQKSARIREINKSSNSQINGLLTPGQRETWQKRRFDRREDVRDRREDRRDKREDVRDRREDRRDAKHDGGVRDRREDRRDTREDKRDKAEDRRDRREDKRDAKHGSVPKKKSS